MKTLSKDEVQQVSGGIIDDMGGGGGRTLGGGGSGSSKNWPFYCFACED